MGTIIRDRKLLINYIIIGILGAIILVVSGITVGYFDFQQFRMKETEKINRNVMIVSNRFQTVMSSFYLVVKMLDDWIDKNPDKDPRFDPEFNKMVETYREHTKKNMDIRMVTPDGKLFYFPSKTDKPLADVKDREYYKAHIEKDVNGIYFAEPVLSRVTGKWGIPISYKVKSKNDRVFILFGAIEFSTLDELFQGISDDYGRKIIIVREDEKILYRRPFDEQMVGKSIEEFVENTKEIRGENNIRIVKKRGAERRLVGFNNIDGFPVSAIISENYDAGVHKWSVGFAIKMLIIIVVIVIFIVLNLRVIRLFEELHKANETKDKFLALIAHDIKGPIGNGALLLDITIGNRKSILKDELFEVVTVLRDSMKNMYDLLEDLINWAMLQKQQMIFRPVEIDTTTILSECLNVLNPIAEMKKIKIIFYNQESFPLFADKQMMITVFRNFISNSIKFTNEGGIIKIIAAKNDSKIKISVEDTGVGIAKERIEKLFNIYGQESTFGTKSEKGTGLGLIICKEFVEKNGGKIQVKSEIGKGTTFTVILPIGNEKTS